MNLVERMSAAFDIITGKLDTSAKAAQDAAAAQKQAESDRDTAVSQLGAANDHITDLNTQLGAANDKATALQAQLDAEGDPTALTALVTKAEALAAQP